MKCQNTKPFTARKTDCTFDRGLRAPGPDLPAHCSVATAAGFRLALLTLFSPIVASSAIVISCSKPHPADDVAAVGDKSGATVSGRGGAVSMRGGRGGAPAS